MNYGLFSSGLRNADDPRRRKLAGSLEGVVGRARSARTMQDWPRRAACVVCKRGLRTSGSVNAAKVSSP